ncbi:MAG: hypothetical protein IJV22_06165 [Bacteroidales bacterium]|nr:hypothetical protein [Bacteroidales bacterium]
MDWVEIVIGFVGGGMVSMLTIPSVVKRSKAEARAVELDNLQKAVEGWKELADERQEANHDRDSRIKELNEKIDSLYEQIGVLRADRDAKIEENTTLKVKIATDEVKLCMVRGCASREPQSGY